MCTSQGGTSALHVEKYAHLTLRAELLKPESVQTPEREKILLQLPRIYKHFSITYPSYELATRYKVLMLKVIQIYKLHL